jgi:hypothetical protein
MGVLAQFCHALGLLLPHLDISRDSVEPMEVRFHVLDTIAGELCVQCRNSLLHRIDGSDRIVFHLDGLFDELIQIDLRAVCFPCRLFLRLDRV